MEDGWKSVLLFTIYAVLNSYRKNTITSISYNLKSQKLDFRMGNSKKLVVNPNSIKYKMEGGEISTMSYGKRELVLANEGKWDSKELFTYIIRNGRLFHP